MGTEPCGWVCGNRVGVHLLGIESQAIDFGEAIEAKPALEG